MGASARAGTSLALTSVLYSGFVPFLPLMVFSWVMSASVHRQVHWWQSPRKAALSFALCTLLLTPMFVVWELLMEIWRSGKQTSSLLDVSVDSLQPIFVWMDLTIVLAAVVGQFAVATWHSMQAKQRELIELARANSELRLALLQGQLEPHFLFNALNTISALVRTSNRVGALAALSRVSELLRFSLRASKDEPLTVADELAFLRNYTGLQELRFADRLQIFWDVEEGEWESISFPPLLSQPLVENAIKFGMSGHHGPSRVDIRLFTEPKRLVLKVSNTLGSEVGLPKGHGLGMKSVSDRIALLFGVHASLQVERPPGAFTAILTLPIEASQ